MKIIVKKVNQNPEVVDIPNDFYKMQEIVGGYIEAFPITNDILCVCNEEGKLKGLDSNFKFCGDIIVGDVFFCSVDREDFGSLNEDQVYIIMTAFTNRT